MIDWALGDSFGILSCPCLEYCSDVCCSAAVKHLKLLEHLFRGASFLTGCMFECNIAHCRSESVLCMLYKIRCNPMHPRYAWRFIRAISESAYYKWCIGRTWVYLGPHRCRTSQYHRTFISLSVSLQNDLSDPVFDGVGLESFKSRVNALSLAWAARSFCLFSCFPFFLYFYGLVLWDWGLRTDRVASLSPGLEFPDPFNNNNKNWSHFLPFFALVTEEKWSFEEMTNQFSKNSDFVSLEIKHKEYTENIVNNSLMKIK